MSIGIKIDENKIFDHLCKVFASKKFSCVVLITLKESR